MSDVHSYSSDVAFTPAVKEIQTRKGSANAYAHVEESGGWRTEIDANLAAFLAEARQPVFRDRERATASPISSIAADRRASSRSWTRTRWRSPITAATGNTSRKATCPKTPKPTSS